MLAKPLATRFIQGTPEVPYQAAYTHCGQTPAPGYWQSVCDGVWLPAGYQCSNGGVTSPTHDHSTDPLILTFMPTVCRSQFVQTGPPGPVVCTSYPEQPHVPGTPSRLEKYPDFGWNAGANSITSRGGDFFIRDTMDAVTGVAWGIVTNRLNVPDPNRITHGFMFSRDSNANPRFRVIESGKVVMAERPYVAGDEFEIQRVAGWVTYWHAGEQVHASATPSAGEVLVGSSLYGSGDTIQ